MLLLVKFSYFEILEAMAGFASLRIFGFGCGAVVDLGAQVE